MEHKKAKIYNPLHSLTTLNELTNKACAEIVEILRKSPFPEAKDNATFLLS